MKLRVIQTIEVEGEVVERLEVEVTMESGESFPAGHSNITACCDGTLLFYEGYKTHFVAVSPGKTEPMLTLDGKPLDKPFKQVFGKGQNLTLVLARRGNFVIVRQVISLK